MKHLPVVQALLDVVDGAAALVDADGCIFEKNCRFRALADGRSLFTLDRRNRIILPDAAQDRLTKAIALATGNTNETKAAVFPASLHGKRWVLSVLPVENQTTGLRLALLILTRASHRAFVSADLLRPHYGLTGAEAEITACIAHGKTILEAAEQLGVSKATARNQLAAAMTKLGVSRQAGLVARANAITPRLHLKGHSNRESDT